MATSEAKVRHTPGPWKAHSASMSDGTLVVTAALPDGNGFERICVVRDRTKRDYSDEDYRSQANATLIAAAPELLEALQDIVEQAGKTKMMLPADLADSIRVFGRAAISKATD